MSKQKITLKDDRLHVIGYVEIDDDGNKVLKDDRLKVKGYYDKRRNVTKNDRLKVVGYGDILTSLL